MSCIRLNSAFFLNDLGQSRTFPPSQTTTIRSMISGAFSSAEATLLIAPMAMT
jgi:hypothetical protein